MPLEPSKFSPNEAWLLFRLNDAPVLTKSDGDFHAMAIMEIASGMILGMDLVPVTQGQLSELQARKLLSDSATQSGGRATCLYVASGQVLDHVSTAAATMGIAITRAPASELDEITREAREGFAVHVSKGRMQ